MSIFDDNNKVSGAFFSFKKIGDRVEGTLIDKRQTPDKFNPGKMQWIYELKGAEGETILIGGKPGIDMQMKNIKFGQVVGLVYEKDKPNINPALQATHIIQVYANSNIVDEQWIKEKEMEIPSEEQGITISSEDNTLDLFDSPEEKLEKIFTLAEIKLGIKDQAEAQKAIMEKTGLPFLESNYDDIIGKLKNI